MSDRAQTFENAPMADLLGILLRQMRRPLTTHGWHMTDTEAVRIAQERVENGKLADVELVKAIIEAVKESQDVLTKMGLTFEQSLDADMNTIGGWTSTAEFLELANEKSNAELRITVGAALALVFGERQFVASLLYLAGGDYGDETVIARRVLSFASGVAPDAANWLALVRQWVAG